MLPYSRPPVREQGQIGKVEGIAGVLCLRGLKRVFCAREVPLKHDAASTAIQR